MSEPRYDVFVSYSRKDDSNGQITTLLNQLALAYREITGKPLRVFFDKDAIEGMDRWRDQILGHLESSSLLITFVSPHYLASPYCQWEFSEYLKGEIARSTDGILPLYLHDIPDWDLDAYAATAPDWVRLLRERQRIDLRNGAAGLHTAAQRIASRLQRIEQAETKPPQPPPPQPRLHRPHHRNGAASPRPHLPRPRLHHPPRPRRHRQNRARCRVRP